MLDGFLDTADAAQVMELMREAELRVLQLTDAVEWPGDASTVSIVLQVPPARLVLLRQVHGEEHELHPDGSIPPQVIEQLKARLDRETLWRRVRAALDVHLR